MTSIYTKNVAELKELNHLFIELTEKNCNQRCRECYIDFPITKNIKDFISVDKIKEALVDTKKENLECIYLTGAEPMTHPNFNSILRMCLKRTNVCICTNGSFINEKKARFLKRVEDESEYEIFIKLPFAHYLEFENDSVRSRGSYRQVINAIKCMQKYDFTIVVSICNYYKLPKDLIINEFNKIFNDKGILEVNFQITEFYNPKEKQTDISDFQDLDCKSGRILTSKGVYTCPFLSNDYRGRCGNSFKDFSKNTYLETPFCTACAKNKERMFSLN